MTLQVHVRVLDGDALLRPEMLCHVRFLGEGGPSSAPAGTARAGGGLLVPARVVVDDKFVWTLDPDGGAGAEAAGRRSGRGPASGSSSRRDSTSRTRSSTSAGIRSRTERGCEHGRESDMAFIELRGVTKTYRKGEHVVTPLEDVTLDIEQGEFFALLGPSGSGKTTLLNLLAAIDRPDRGTIRVGGEDLGAKAARELADWRAEHVGYVFQQANLVPVLTAYENVELPLWLHKLSRAERHRRVLVALEAVGLLDRADHFPRQLSGGQEQRVAIARAIVADPTLLVADEPTGNLDHDSAEGILAAPRPAERRVQEDDRDGDPRPEGGASTARAPSTSTRARCARWTRPKGAAR